MPTPTKHRSSFNLVNFTLCLHSYQLHCNKFVVVVQSLSCVWLLPCPSPGDLPNPGIKPSSPVLQADSLPLSHLRSLCNKLPTPSLKYLIYLCIENQGMSYSSQKAAIKMISQVTVHCKVTLGELLSQAHSHGSCQDSEDPVSDSHAAVDSSQVLLVSGERYQFLATQSSPCGQLQHFHCIPRVSEWQEP